MGQEAYVEQRIAKRGDSTIPIGGRNVELKQSSTTLLEQQVGGNVTVAELAEILLVRPKVRKTCSKDSGFGCPGAGAFGWS